MDPAQVLEAAALAQQQPVLDAIAKGESDVQRFYKNSVVFLTGGSGFLGKQLLGKLMRSCQISKVYMLLRSKKGKSVQDRKQEILKDPGFNSLRLTQPDFGNKIEIIEGDVEKVKLGIDNSDWKTLTTEVDIIFHVAATTKFDEHLQRATLINVRGTREVLLLGKACVKLRSYVHVSTAYSHAFASPNVCEVQEKFYDVPIQPETMISLAENMDFDRLNGITTNLIKGWPNTYTFTKAIAEELVRTSSVGVPICIVRPSIVFSSYQEPVPGWLDKSCIFGGMGLLLATGLGALHAILIKPQVKIGFIPCDYVNNAVIVAAKEAATNQAKGGNDTKIYNITSTARNPFTCDKLINVSIDYARRYGTSKAIYYIYVILTPSVFWFNFLGFFLHLIPAFIADCISALTGNKRRFVKLVRKYQHLSYALSHFTLNEWKFTDDNLVKLYEDLSDQDKTIFNFDICNLNWSQYIIHLCIGLRRYIIKDGLKNTEYAAKKQKMLKIVHYVFTMIFIYCSWMVICYMFNYGSTLFSSIV